MAAAPPMLTDTRIAIDGSRIETPETFAIDWTQLKDGKTFEGDGARNEEHYAFGADVLAVADGTVVSVRDGMPEETPWKPPVAVHAPRGLWRQLRHSSARGKCLCRLSA